MPYVFDKNREPQFATSDMTEGMRRERKAIQKRHSKEWRDFWIRVQHAKGYSNVEIAGQFGISESTVRRVLS